MPDKVKTRRRMIAPLLGEGEQALACTQVSFQLRYGIDWLEGAVPPPEPSPPTRVDKGLQVGSSILSVVLGGDGDMDPAPSAPEVRSAFDVIAAGPAGSYAYRMVYAARRLKFLRDAPYFLVTSNRLIFAVDQKGQRFEVLVDVPLREVAAAARRKDVLLIEFTDASFVRIFVSDNLRTAKTARKLTELLAPGGEREPDLARYAPPWARMA